MRRGLSFVIVGLMSIVLTGALSTVQAQQSGKAAEFYRGTKVTLVVVFPPGGGADTFGRILVPALTKALGVKEIVLQNKPGGGSYRGLNWIYQRARRDGTTIALCNGQIALTNEILGEAKVAKFKSMKEFTILGGSAGAPASVLVNPKLPYKSLKDMKGAKGLKSGTPKPVDSHSINGSILAECLKFQDYQIISGYSGTAELATAVMRGELTLLLSSYMTLKKYVDQGVARIVGVMSDERVPIYPDTPSIYEVDIAPHAKKYLTTAVTTRSAMRLLIGPPGIPKDRAQFLSNAIWKVLQDKQVHQEFTKRGSIIYRPGNAKEILARVDKVLALSEKDRKDFKALILKNIR